MPVNLRIPFRGRIVRNPRPKSTGKLTFVSRTACRGIVKRHAYKDILVGLDTYDPEPHWDIGSPSRKVRVERKGVL